MLWPNHKLKLKLTQFFTRTYNITKLIKYLQDLLGYIDKDPALVCRECFKKPCVLKCKDHFIFALLNAKETALLVNLDGHPYPIQSKYDEENNLISIGGALRRYHGGLGCGYKYSFYAF